MQKISITLLVYIYITGCSVSRVKSHNKTNNKDIVLEYIDLKETSTKNLTSVPFFIQKAEIEIINEDKKQKLIASIKFNKPDSFMVSVRSSSGVEAVRIFFTSDTILINDRINKVFYYGSKSAINQKFGISSKFFPLFFGDIIYDKKIDPIVFKCENSVSTIDSFFDGNRIIYVIDCNNSRLISTSLFRRNEQKPVLMKYKSFEKFSFMNFPGRVSISGLDDFDIINIEFTRMQVPWEGRISFIPGNNYEQREIK